MYIMTDSEDVLREGAVSSTLKKVGVKLLLNQINYVPLVYQILATIKFLSIPEEYIEICGYLKISHRARKSILDHCVQAIFNARIQIKLS